MHLINRRIPLRRRTVDLLSHVARCVHAGLAARRGRYLKPIRCGLLVVQLVTTTSAQIQFMSPFPVRACSLSQHNMWCKMSAFDVRDEVEQLIAYTFCTTMSSRCAQGKSLVPVMKAPVDPSAVHTAALSQFPRSWQNQTAVNGGCSDVVTHHKTSLTRRWPAKHYFKTTCTG